MKTEPKVNQALQALTKLKPEAETSTKTLSASEVILAPTNTLSKINQALDLFVDQMVLRAKEGSAGLKDIKALGELVKANATLRQTQLAEDAQAKSALSIESDEQIATLLVSALSAGGPKALAAFEEAFKQLHSEEPESS